MLNLLLTQLMAMLKADGFDVEKVQSQIGEAIGDLKAMKESQDRCEAMLVRLCAYTFPPEIPVQTLNRSNGGGNDNA